MEHVGPIAVCNLKGGAGKTSTAVGLAAALGEAGHRVLVVDLDPQGSASAWLGNTTGDPGLLGVLRGSGQLREEQATALRVTLVPFCADLASEESGLDHSTASRHLRAALAGLSRDYPFIILDTPPTVNALTFAALVASAHVVIPAEMSALALDGVRATVEEVRDVAGKLNKGLSLAGILPCRVDRSALSRDVLAGLVAAYGRDVFRSTIRESARVKAAPFTQLAVTLYAPKSAVANDYRAAAAELRRRTR